MGSELEKFDLSIVVPVMNEQDTVPLFVEKVSQICLELKVSYEIIFVNDGSTDLTLNTLLDAQARYPSITVVNLSRNFGKEIALTAGLDHVNAQAVIPMDVDLQDPPHVIPDLYNKFIEGFDVVIAVRSKRDGDSRSKKIFARAFYWLFEKISDTPIIKQAGDFRIMSDRVVSVIRDMPERSRFMKGLFSWPGFKTTHIEYERANRTNGDTKFKFVNLWKLALDGVFSFSTLPLKIWTYIGGTLAILSIVYMIFTVLKTMILGIDMPGYASLVTFVLLIGGMNLIGIGILGEYIGRIFIEVKGRPLYIVESVRRSSEQIEKEESSKL